MHVHVYLQEAPVPRQTAFRTVVVLREVPLEAQKKAVPVWFGTAHVPQKSASLSHAIGIGLCTGEGTGPCITGTIESLAAHCSCLRGGVALISKLLGNERGRLGDEFVHVQQKSREYFSSDDSAPKPLKYKKHTAQSQHPACMRVHNTRQGHEPVRHAMDAR